MLSAPTAAVWFEPPGSFAQARLSAPSAPVGCGGWHGSSAELRQGLTVIEHDSGDAEMLLEFVSFE